MVKDPNITPSRKRGALPTPKDIMDAAVPFRHNASGSPDDLPDGSKPMKELDQFETGTGEFKMADMTSDVGGKGTPGTPPPPAGTKAASTQGSSGNVGTPGMPPPPAGAKAASDHGSSGNVGKPGTPPPPK